MMTQRELIESLFSPGSRVIIEYVDEQGAVSNSSTRVEDLESSYLVLQVPVIGGNLQPGFRESQELTVRRLDDLKKTAYVTNVFVIDIRQDKIPLLVCSKPQKISKTSLRRFARFGIDLPFYYRNQKTTGSGRLKDLSLSGCYVLIDPDSEVNEGVLLRLAISIPGEFDIVVEGRVIRADQLAESGKIGLAVDYQNITEAVKEAIYNYIFQLQLTSDRFFGDGPESNDH